MTRSSASQGNCPIARVTDLLGDGWSLMIIRDAFLGARRFNQFERSLGIARNILADRLRKLVDAGLMERNASSEDGRVFEYRLTPAGRGLFPVLISLTQWADRHTDDCGHSVRFVEWATGEDIASMQVRSRDGRPLSLREITMLPGPSADPVLRARLEAALERAAAESGKSSTETSS